MSAAFRYPSNYQAAHTELQKFRAQPLQKYTYIVAVVMLVLFGSSILPNQANALVVYNATRVANLPASMFDESLEIVYFDAIARPQEDGRWTDSVFCDLTIESVAERLRGKYSNYTGIMMLDVEPNLVTNFLGDYSYPCLSTYQLTPDDNFAAIPLYLTILEGARQAAPKAKIGFYGIPQAAFRVAFTEAGYQFDWATPQTEDEYVANEKILYNRLTKYTDVLFPVAYWHGMWLDVYTRAWQLQATSGAFVHWNKSIIFTVSPYKENACGFLDPASVRFQLNTLKSLGATGIVYWVYDYETSNMPVPYWAQQNCHWPTQNMSITTQAEWFQNSTTNGISHSQYPDSQWMHEVEIFNRSD